MTIARFINEIGFKVKNEDVKKVNNTMSNIKDTASKILGAIGIGFSLSAVNNLVEEFSRVKDQIRNSTSELGNQADIQDKILAAATATRSEYSQTAGVVANLVHENSELFGTIDEAINFNNAATMLFKTAGKTNEEIAGLMEAINKSFAKGYVDSETISQLLEESPEAVQLLNRHLGTTSDQLEQLASDGKMTVADLKAAFVDNAAAIEAAFGNVKLTVSDALTIIRNKWGLWLADTNEMLGITNGIGNFMVSAFDGVVRALTKVRTGVVWLSEKLGGMENLTKLITIAAGAILFAFNFDKITSGIAAVIKFLRTANGQTLATIAEILIIALLVDDFVNFMQGNDSLFGSMLEKAGVDCNALRETIVSAWSYIKEQLIMVWDHLKVAGTKVWKTIQKAAKSIFEGLKSFWAKWGNDIKATFGVVFSACKDIFDGFLDVVIGLADFIGAVFSGDWKAAWQAILDVFSAIWNTLISFASAKMESLKLLFTIALDFLSNLWSSVWNGIKSITATLWNAIKNAITTPINAAKNTITSVVNSISSAISGVWNTIKSTTTAVWNSIKSAIITPINNAWSTVSSVIGKLKNAFNFSWSLPKLKLPHITVTGGVAPFGIGGKGSLPRFSISWYRKGGILDGATIFGTMGNQLLGGGEAGKEAVLPLTELWTNMRAMIMEGVATLTANLSPLADLNMVTPTTAGNLVSNSSTRTIVMNNTFNQHFSGEKTAQQKSSTAMERAATDITGELARALAYTG